MQEKAAISALEPQLVVVNDYVCGSHHSHWQLRVDARSIQPLARHFVGKVVDASGIFANRRRPAPFCGETDASKSSNRLRETINPVTGLIQQRRKCHAA